MSFLLSRAAGSGQLYLQSDLGFQAPYNIMYHQVVVVIITKLRGISEKWEQSWLINRVPKAFPTLLQFVLIFHFHSCGWITGDESWWDHTCHQILLAVVGKCPQVWTEQCNYISLRAVNFSVRHYNSVPRRMWDTDPKFSFHLFGFFWKMLVCHSVTLILNGLAFQNAFISGSNCHGTWVLTIQAWPIKRWIAI